MTVHYGRRSAGLVGTNRDLYLPDLAKALNTMAEELIDSNQSGEAVLASSEAVALYQALAQDPNAAALDIEGAVLTHARALGRVGRIAEAVATLADAQQRAESNDNDEAMEDIKAAIVDLRQTAGNAVAVAWEAATGTSPPEWVRGS